jgi:hypothetical protein
MKLLLLYILLTCGGLTILFTLFFIYFKLWYADNYITKESTDKYPKGWHKCFWCKGVESTIFFYDTIFGRIYKCEKCSEISRKK